MQCSSSKAVRRGFNAVALGLVFMFARVSNFLNKNKLLTNLQYGFRNNASTELATSPIYERFLENMDKGKSTYAVFLD